MQKQTKKINPPTIVVYFDPERKHKQVLKPTEDFNGDCATLVRDMFNTVLIDENQIVTYHRNYHSYEIINP